MQEQSITTMFSSISSYFKRPKLSDSAKFSIIKDSFTITPDELGRGSYGIVYATQYNGKPRVVKELDVYLSHHNTPEPIEDLYKEINSLATLKHPCIVQFLGFYFKGMSTPPMLVMESLLNLLEERPN